MTHALRTGKKKRKGSSHYDSMRKEQLSANALRQKLNRHVQGAESSPVAGAE